MAVLAQLAHDMLQWLAPRFRKAAAPAVPAPPPVAVVPKELPKVRERPVSPQLPRRRKLGFKGFRRDLEDFQGILAVFGHIWASAPP